ncbi:S8 family peptidase [Thermococcus pacificus]|uniref:Pyrolysin (Pls) n=1 Tax=Thermococcus pacificus TaxID=71998 RepID=A0A218P7N5_9EURY|nr:S8 family serine peptidase [Thermococcus pacificus]ASJ06793.1 pyrolysin (pls) [Thermococcus pacificus]
MNRKALSLLIVAVMVLSIVPVMLPEISVSAASADNLKDTPTSVASSTTNTNFVKGEALQKEIQRILQTSDRTVRLIVAPDREHAMEVYNALKDLGRIDPISRPEYQFIVIEMPVSNVEKLADIPGILHVWKDRMVKLQEPVSPEENVLAESPAKESPKLPDMFMSVFTINAYNVWDNYGIYGDNVIVAILDTGIDVAHPFLQTTLDGRPKIIHIKDMSDEGMVEIYHTTTTVSGGVISVNKDVTVYWGAYANYYGHDPITTYHMGDYVVGSISGDVYYLGLLPERYFDLNNFSGVPNDPYGFGLFGDLSDVYPVLIVNQSGNLFAYIDFNLNNDFTDEEPMGIYDLTRDYVVVSTTNVTVAFEGFYGNVAYFMWDAHGHGTHVSGTVAGVGLPSDPVFYGVYGVAPNAQLMEYKVLPGEQGFGRTSWIINGMIEATLDGADVISMSLGGGGEINDGLETPEIFYVNLLSDYYGVVFAIAAGNEGPTTNSVHAPGDSDLAITVGNYWESERWELLYGLPGVANGPAMGSSRGPRDDGLLDPDVMAPGTDIFSSLPMWYTVLYEDPYRYYGFWSGTSMATPHVSGAVALMISYAKARGIPYDPIMIKRALELSAKPTNQTLVDQGFGLIQVDKAIAKLEELSQEPSIYIFAGTTFTSFKNPIEVPLIPISQAYVDFNGYFQSVFGFPYLYRGVYIRDEFPGSVPIYFSPLEYWQGWGLGYVFENKMYTISTNVDWIIPNTTEVTIHGADARYIEDLMGQFSISIDYSRLQKSGTYVGLVYIDDPDTSYIDGYVPVIVDIPLNRNGELSATISDTANPGETKHYFFNVPRGTKELRITLRIPTDSEGTPMGRVKLVIARPLGEVVYDGVPGYLYAGPGGPLEYTWIVENPVEGNWEITAYVSVSSYASTGYEKAHYEIEVMTSDVEMNPELIVKDIAEPGTINVQAQVINNYETFNAEPVGYGMGRLDIAEGTMSQVGQDEVDIVGYAGVDPTTYFLKMGITDPEDPAADLDLYVAYYTTYEQMVNDLQDGYINDYTTLYTDQIGPTSEEVLELFMPDPGYYLVYVYGYDTAGHDKITYTFYYQILGDSGDISIQSEPFEFMKGAKETLEASVSISDEGTYLGIIGLRNSDTGEILSYAPIIIQAGKPSMTMVFSTNATIGKGSVIKIKFIDPVTDEPIKGETKVVVNGVPYYTDDGTLTVYYVPKHLEETFTINAINSQYQDIETQIAVKAKEPFDSTIEYTTRITPKVISGFGQVASYETYGNRLRITVDGPSGYEGYVLVPLPYSSGYAKVEGEGVVDYYYEVGSMATYLIVKVKYGSPVTFTVDFVPVKPAVSGINYFYYSRYLRLNQTFTELYQKAVELGVDNETLQMALNYQQAAEAWYKEGLEYMNPMATSSGVLAMIRFRRAYVSIQDAIRILEKAVEELQAS